MPLSAWTADLTLFGTPDASKVRLAVKLSVGFGRSGAERAVAGDDQRAGEERGAAGIGIGGIGQRDRAAVVGAELHDEADIRRADR